jgi:hypothetical protein
MVRGHFIFESFGTKNHTYKDRVQLSLFDGHKIVNEYGRNTITDGSLRVLLSSFCTMGYKRHICQNTVKFVDCALFRGNIPFEIREYIWSYVRHVIIDYILCELHTGEYIMCDARSSPYYMMISVPSAFVTDPIINKNGEFWKLLPFYFQVNHVKRILIRITEDLLYYNYLSEPEIFRMVTNSMSIIYHIKRLSLPLIKDCFTHMPDGNYVQIMPPSNLRVQNGDNLIYYIPDLNPTFCSGNDGYRALFLYKYSKLLKLKGKTRSLQAKFLLGWVQDNEHNKFIREVLEGLSVQSEEECD